MLFVHNRKIAAVLYPWVRLVDDPTLAKDAPPFGFVRRHLSWLMKEIFFLKWSSNTIYTATAA